MNKILKIVLAVCVTHCVSETQAELSLRDRIGGTLQYWRRVANRDYRAEKTTDEMVEKAFDWAVAVVGNESAMTRSFTDDSRPENIVDGMRIFMKKFGLSTRTADDQNFIVMVVKLAGAVADYVIEDEAKVREIRDLCESKVGKNRDPDDKWWYTSDAAGTFDHDPVGFCDKLIGDLKLEGYIEEISGSLRYAANPGREQNDPDCVEILSGPGLCGFDLGAAYHVLARIPGFRESIEKSAQCIEKSARRIDSSGSNRTLLCAGLLMSDAMLYGRPGVMVKARLVSNMTCDKCVIDLIMSTSKAIRAALQDDKMLRNFQCQEFYQENGDGRFVKLAKCPSPNLEHGKDLDELEVYNDCNDLIDYLNFKDCVGYVDEDRCTWRIPRKLGDHPLFTLSDEFSQWKDGSFDTSGYSTPYCELQSLLESKVVEERFHWDGRKWASGPEPVMPDAGPPSKNVAEYVLDSAIACVCDREGEASCLSIHLNQGREPIIHGRKNVDRDGSIIELTGYSGFIFRAYSIGA